MSIKINYEIKLEKLILVENPLFKGAEIYVCQCAELESF